MDLGRLKVVTTDNARPVYMLDQTCRYEFWDYKRWSLAEHKNPKDFIKHWEILYSRKTGKQYHLNFDLLREAK